MNEWSQMTEAYLKEHRSKNLKQPKRRENALSAIESLLKENWQEIFSKEKLSELGKQELIGKLTKTKGAPLSGAELSVINGLYKQFKDL